MDEFLTVFGQGEILGLRQILASLLMAFVLSCVYAAVYRWTFQGFSYSRAFVHTMVLGSMVTAMLIMAIGNNLARGLGILGTLAIIRFRTPIRDPRDMVFLFASLGVGIACGAHTLNVAVIGTLTICGAALLLHKSPFGSRREFEGMLRFFLEPGAEGKEDEIKVILRACCSAYHLVAMREAAQGDLLEYSYQIRLIDPSYQPDLVEGLHGVEGITDASLMMRRTTVEL